MLLKRNVEYTVTRNAVAHALAEKKSQYLCYENFCHDLLRVNTNVAELHARLIDHHPVLQGHINYFVKEFEEKRNNREIERLQKTSEAINEMNNRLIPESEDAMKTFLINVTAKCNIVLKLCSVKVATEVCKKIVEKENSVDVLKILI
ncbi:hypothetical protein KUTeg_000461 [Tegillarca granosa]|uniref:Biogenesis of lysosome-related organelles complex 1 subunit 5 n=1 Tax=Tegillarca granosa TaxID=220873 RepID=A0ABQ9G209_TEGGR|nr:hypothetical protein KUTeg_000461 [Tegillarca granosa]